MTILFLYSSKNTFYNSYPHQSTFEIRDKRGLNLHSLTRHVLLSILSGT